MITTSQTQINTTINALFKDAKNDHLKMIKGFSKAIFRPLQPSDFEHVYLSISKAQGEDLVKLIQKQQCKNIVEFGTSFGISTLYLAQGILETEGNIITTELLPSKAAKAKESFDKAGVSEYIEVRVGDALETLKGHKQPIDLLLLDGWKDLYLPLFNMLEPNFHDNTIIYVDNADMAEVKVFLKTIAQNKDYKLQTKHQGKVVLISKK